jgi:hypothetical protein
MVMLAIVHVRMNMCRAIRMGVCVGMCRGTRDRVRAGVAMHMLAVMVMRMRMGRTVGMRMRMFMLVMRMRMGGPMIVVGMAVRRAILVHVPVFMAVFVPVHGFAFDTRFTGRATASGTHPSRSSSVLLYVCSNLLRVL